MKSPKCNKNKILQRRNPERGWKWKSCRGGCAAAEQLTQEHIISALRSAGTLLSDGQYKLRCRSRDPQRPTRAELEPASEWVYWSRRRRPEGRWACYHHTDQSQRAWWWCKWATCHSFCLGSGSLKEQFHIRELTPLHNIHDIKGARRGLYCVALGFASQATYGCSAPWLVEKKLLKVSVQLFLVSNQLKNIDDF